MRYSLPETAKLIRAVLKTVFPDTKFSVTSQSYSMGCRISVRYTDGPLTRDVDAILDHFEAAGFDAMQDLKTYNKPVLFRGEETTFGADYINVSRSLSAAVYQAAALRVHHETGLPLLTFEDGSFKDGEYQISWSYFPTEECICSGTSCRIAGGEWYSHLVYQVAHCTATPHQRGTVDLPIKIATKLTEFAPEFALIN